MSENDAKDALKEALKEWLDDQFATVGRWTFRSVSVAALGALAYFILQMNGWHPPIK